VQIDRDFVTYAPTYVGRTVSRLDGELVAAGVTLTPAQLIQQAGA
jgi:hypothetical protein